MMCDLKKEKSTFKTRKDDPDVDIYLKKKRWKWFLFGAAVVIVSISLYLTNVLVEEIRKDERKNVEIWADAIHHRERIVNYTNKLFEQIKVEEICA